MYDLFRITYRQETLYFRNISQIIKARLSFNMLVKTTVSVKDDTETPRVCFYSRDKGAQI